MDTRRLIGELRRRRVFRTAGLYLIGAWVIIQVAATTFGPLGLPGWALTVLVWAVIIGFPLALILGWRYELGPAGISRTAPATGDAADLTLRPGDYLILALVITVVGAAAYGLVGGRNANIDMRRADFGFGERPAADMIAVLPFTIEGADSDDEYLIQGLSDELRNRLSNLPGISVAGRSSSEAFGREGEDPVRTAGSMGIATIVEGRARSGDGILSVSLDVTDGRTGGHVWSGRFDRPSTEILVLQQEIVAAVVDRIAPEVTAIAASTVPATESAEANDHFLLGRYYDQQVRDSQLIDLDTMISAIEQYELAIRADPDMADAHARLANALLFMGYADAAAEPILEAESLNENSSEVQYTLATYRMAHHLAGIEQAFRAAIELNPNNGDALEDYAVYLWHQGDNATPEELLKRAIELDPLVLFRFDRLGNLYAWNGRTKEALEVARTVERRFPTDEGYMVSARLHELVGLLDEAIVRALKAKAANPSRRDIDWQLAELYARLGDYEMTDRFEPEPSIMKLYWQRQYQDLIDLGDEQILDSSLIELTTFYMIAFGYSTLGDNERAVDVYERAVAAFAGIGMPEIATHDSRIAISTEHLAHYAAALKAIGREEDARAAAQWLDGSLMSRHYETGNTVDWWATTYDACALVVLGEKERALEALARIRSSPGLPWYPLLRDAPCFEPVENDPRFRDVIASVEDRIATIRRRLPATLAAAGFDPAAIAP